MAPGSHNRSLVHDSIYAARRLIEWGLIQIPRLRNLYWEYAPAYFRRRLQPDVDDIELDINSFEIHYVDPEIINRFSGINVPAGKRISDIGGIIDGSWDQSIDKQNMSLITANRIDETVLYAAMVSHFIDGVPWDETALLKEFDNSLSSKQYREDCHSMDELQERCNYIDELYNRIGSEGYKSQNQLLQAWNGIIPFEKAGFLNTLVNEITVDISRDGELLLADGRHRLIIAKLQDLDEIPVFIMARHSSWIDKLNHRSTESIPEHHPDKKYL